eukprot:scaffold133371_cov18-Prasinocladus_malaysianus.AAC.1
MQRRLVRRIKRLYQKEAQKKLQLWPLRHALPEKKSSVRRYIARTSGSSEPISSTMLSRLNFNASPSSKTHASVCHPVTTDGMEEGLYIAGFGL